MSSEGGAAARGSAGGPGDERRRAYDASLRLLAARARSSSELTDRLTGKGFSERTVGVLVADLENAGLLDDADFARQWVYFRHRDGGRSRRVLREELRRKGVDDEYISAAVDCISEDDERARAARLVRRALSRRSLPAGDDVAACRREQRRLLGMLARKGYGSEISYAVVSEEWAAAGEEGPGGPYTGIG